MITPEQADKAKNIVSGFSDEQKKVFLEKYSSLDSKQKETVISRLLNQNKSTEKSDYISGVKERGAEAQREIVGRGSILSQLQESSSSKNNLVKYGLTPLKAIGAPFQALQSGIANPALQMQQGNFDPGRLLKESALGFSGQKLGEYGDVYRTGIPGFAGKAAGVVGGLTLDVAGPVKAFKAAKTSIFGNISKSTDKNILNAGNSLVEATKKAESYSGQKLNDAFKTIDDTKVDPMEFSNSVSKLPQVLISKIEESFGPIGDLSENMTVSKLRQFKQLLGKYNPSSFGKEERGLAENIQADDINKAYGAAKNLLKDTIKKSWGEKSANQLMRLEEAFSEVSRASNSVRRTVVDPILFKATKAGKMAGKIVEEGDVTSREALKTLRNSGPEAKKAIDKAINALEHFNRIQRNTKIAKHIAGALTYGGAIGAIGGSLAGGILNRGKGNLVE